MTMARMKLTRELGLLNALTLGIGTMIGAGIFILPSFAAGRAGPAASISYLIGGVIAILTAISLSELATGMSKAGGSYYFINRSLGPFFGTITGLGMWVGLIFASSFYMIGFEYYLSNLIGDDVSFSFLTFNTRAVAILVTIALIAINYLGTKGAGRFQNVIVLLLLLILTIFIVWGSFHVDPDNNLKPFAPEGWGPVIGVAGLVFIGFLGFEVVATVAEEIKKPEKNLWRAMIGSVVVVTIMYMAVMIVATGVVGYKEEGDAGYEEGSEISKLLDHDAPISYTAEQFMGGVGGVLITIAAILATVSSANASILSASRISLAMGKDRILHPWTNKIHLKFATPSNAILLTGILILTFLVLGEVETLAEVAGFMFLLTFILVHACVWVLRRTDPEWYHPSFRSPLFPYLQGAGAILCVALMVMMSPSSIISGLIMVGIALVWYRYWSRKKSKVVGEVKKVFEDRKLEEAKKVISGEGEQQSKIIVPFSNVLYEPWKIKLAAALATEKGVLVRLNVVEIPDQTPLERAMEHIVLDHLKVMDKIKDIDANVKGKKDYKQIIAHSIPSTIVNLARQEDCELIFLSRSRAKLPTTRIKETFTNFILHRSKVDIAVLTMSDEVKEKIKPGRVPNLQKILVPFDENPHAILALEFARKISVAEGAKVTLFMVSYKKDFKQRQEKMEKMLRDFSSKSFTIEPKIIIGRSPAKEIIKASKEYDLIVMGASRMWVLNKFLFGSIPDRVLATASCPVLIAKKWERSPIPMMKGRM